MEYSNPDLSLEERDVLKRAVERCKEFGIEPLAFVFHGSRVNGNSYNGSDWDIFVFVNEKQADVELLDFMSDIGYIDLSAEPYLPKRDMKDYFRLRNLSPTMQYKVAWSKSKEYSDFLERIKEFTEYKLNKVNKGTKSSIKNRRLDTLIKRAEIRIVNCPDPLRRSVYISKFMVSIVSAYFYYKNKYEHSISDGHLIIKNEDPILYKLLVSLPRLKSKRSVKKNLESIRSYFTELAEKYPGTKD